MAVKIDGPLRGRDLRRISFEGESMKSTITALALLVLIITAACRTPEEQSDPKIVKSKTLSASLILTDHGTEMYKEWEKNSSLFPVWHLAKLKRSIDNILTILVIDCTSDNKGYCNLNVSYKIIKPDGTLYGQYSDKHITPYRGQKKIMSPYLSNSYMVLRMGPKDQLGEYIMQATLTDQISRETISLEERATFK